IQMTRSADHEKENHVLGFGRKMGQPGLHWIEASRLRRPGGKSLRLHKRPKSHRGEAHSTAAHKLTACLFEERIDAVHMCYSRVINSSRFKTAREATIHAAYSVKSTSAGQSFPMIFFASSGALDSSFNCPDTK